jgi:hypothetical protein
MTEKFTAAQWAEMEGGHEVTPAKESSFSFIKDVTEARMTRDSTGTKKLTYSDCCERLYLSLLVLETLRNFPEFRLSVQKYARRTAGFESYRFYRINGSDLYNFIYFVVGDDSAQEKLKDPDAAKKMKANTKIPVRDLNRYINELKDGKQPILVSSLFIKLENALKITNTDYKAIRRALSDFEKLTRADKRRFTTRLIYAVRAKLRSSDIIDDFEKFAAIKDMEKASVPDPEPTISKPDISTAPQDIALYRYLVGADNLMQTKKFLELAKDGKSIPSSMVQAYLPAIKMLDDIVQGGPSFIQGLRTLQKRAQKR